MDRRLRDGLHPLDRAQSLPLRAGRVQVPALCRRSRAGDRRDRPDRPGTLSGFGADLELAERLARRAGELLLERFGEPVSGLESKSSATDMASDADRDAEALIREALERARPEDGLLAEEGSRADAANGRRWIVDPLDGTTNYLYGLPGWAVSIALADSRGTAVGVVCDPLRDETFTATRAGGAQLNGATIAVNEIASLELSLVATGFGYAADRRAQQADVLQRVLPRVRDIRRAGAAALDLCMVACGRLDGYYERGLHEWDWAAGSLIAAEAGATVRPLAGEPFGLVAAAPAIADELATLVE